MITLEKARTMSTESIEFVMNDIMEAVACAMLINDFQARANIKKYMGVYTELAETELAGDRQVLFIYQSKQI